MARIVIIGGGGARGPGLVQAFVDAGEAFAGCELVLYDVNAETLDLVYRLGLHQIQAGGSPIRLQQRTDRRAALAGADLVLTTFRPGGLEARRLDEMLPLEFGIIGHETVGPGGFFFALRVLEVMRGLVADIEAVAPGALLLNYTNPTNIITEAVSRFSKVRVVGLCDGRQSDGRRVMKAMGLQGTPNYWAVGLNHATWGTRFMLDGEDLMPRILAAAPAVEADPATPPVIRRMFHLTRIYGHVACKYLQYYYFPEETVAEARAEGRTRAEQVMAEMSGYWAHYREQLASARPQLTNVRGGMGFGDMAVDVTRAALHNSGEIMQLNVPQQGALDWLPRDTVAELTCCVERHAITPLVQPPLPRDVHGLQSMLAEYQALTAAAGWGGTRSEAVRALAANPLVASLARAEAIYERTAGAEAGYLPQRLLR